MFIIEVGRGCPSEKYPLNGIFELDQAKALQNAGHKIIYASLDVRSLRRWRKWGMFKSTENGVETYNFSFPAGALGGAEDYIQTIGFERLLRRIICEEGRPDLVHGHFAQQAGGSIVRACMKYHIPYVITEHSSLISRDEIPESEKEKLSYIYKNAAAVVAVSGALKDKILKHTGVCARVIPNVINLELFRAENRKDHQKFRFISAGILNKRKGFDVLIKAFSHLHADFPDTELLIMGGGNEEASLRKLIEDEGLRDSVTLSGSYKREEFSQRMSESDAFVLASRRETFGVVYAEAMAAGLPVIATRCGGPEDFVDDDCGIMVDIDNEEQLCSAMRSLCTGRSRFEAEKIRSHISNRVSPENVAGELGKLFASVVNSEK